MLIRIPGHSLRNPLYLADVRWGPLEKEKDFFSNLKKGMHLGLRLEKDKIVSIGCSV